MEKKLTKKEELAHSLMLVLCALIWGSAFVAQSIGAEHVGPLTFLALRNWIGMAFLIPVILIRDRILIRRDGITEKPATRTGWKRLILGGMFCGILLFFASGSQQIGIASTTTAKAGFITAQYVIMVPLISVFFGRKVGTGIWICVMLSLTGLYMLCISGPLELSPGDGYILISAFFFALQIMCVDYCSPAVDPIRFSFVQFFTTAVIATICMYFFEPLSLSDLKEGIWSVLYTGIMSSGVAFTLQIVGQRNLNPTIASLSMSLESVFSALCGWIVLGQALSLREMIGCGLVFAAIILSQLQK